MLANLQQTEFHIEKLRHIVGVGNCSAYQICATPGTVLGRMGRVAHADNRDAANQCRFEERTVGIEQRQDRSAWLKRVVSTIKS